MPEQPPRDRVLYGSGDVDSVLDDLDALEARAGQLPNRIAVEPGQAEQGLAQLVLTVVQLVRDLMERQALRRIDAGSLTEEEIERLGQTFMELDARMQELCETFGLDEDDLNIDLGPLGTLR